MQQEEITIINQLGLHARAAAKLVATASRFESRINLVKDEKSVDAKSIMSVMMLAASVGSNITLRTDGPDEERAIAAVIELINDRFGEDQ